MSTGTRAMGSLRRSRWLLPAFSFAIGVVYFVAELIAGNIALGAEMFAVMAVFSGVILLGGRSETLRGLRGDGRDERFASMDLRATAFSGVIVMIAVLIAFVVEVARGHSGAPYFWLGAIGGLAYLASVVWLRVRG